MESDSSIYDKEDGAISTSSSEEEDSFHSELRMTHQAQLSRIILSRSKLAKFVHAHFFKELAIGCFVRIGIGNNQGEPVYRIAEIGLFFLLRSPLCHNTALVAVVETSKIYQLENSRTNKGVRLKYGKDERVYRMEFVSNSSFTEREFAHWCSTLKKQNVLKPTIAFIGRKEEDIRKADSYRYTNAEIDELVKEKNRFSKKLPNFAQIKGQLLFSKEVAEKDGHYQRAQEIQKRIDDLDRKAEQLKPMRVVKTVPVSTAKRIQSSVPKKRSSNDVPDLSCADYAPFIRKSNIMPVICGTPKSAHTEISKDVDHVAAGRSGDGHTSNGHIETSS